MKRRAHYQERRRADGSTVYRSQMVDPTTGGRLDLLADTPLDLAARSRRVRDVRHDVALGLDPDQAAARLRPAVAVQLKAAEVWESWQRLLPPNTRDNVRSTWARMFAPLFGSAHAWEIQKRALDRWEAWVRPRYAPRTIWRAFELLKAAYNRHIPDDFPRYPWADWRPHIARPAKSALDDPDARPSVGSLEEAAAILHAARAQDDRAAAHGRPTCYQLTLLVLLQCGLRNAEAAGLMWADLALDGSPAIIHIRRQAYRGWHKHPESRGTHGEPIAPVKNRKGDRQALPDQVAGALRGRREQAQRDGWFRELGPVFPGDEKGSWRTSGQALKPAIMRAICAEAGIRDADRWVTHCTRHSAITMKCGNTDDLASVAAFSRHSSLAQMQPYLHRVGKGIPTGAVVEIPMLDGPPSAPALPMLVAPRYVTAKQREKEAAAQKRAARKKAEGRFEDHAIEWIEAGCPGIRPRPVTDATRRCYVAGYRAAENAGADRAACQAAGRRAKRAALGRWGKALAWAKRQRPGSAPPECIEEPLPEPELEADPWGLCPPASK